MSENCFDRQRAAVVRLTDAVRARAAAEAELTATHDAAAERAEREVNRARKSNSAAREGELGRIDETHVSSAGAIERKYDSEQFTADRGREDRRTTTTEKFKAAEQRGRTEHADRLWHIDSMLEAGEKAAKEQLESLQRKAAGCSERIAAIWSEAEPALARGRITRAEVEVAGELPAPNDDDPITRMNRAVQSSEDAIQRLARLYSPKWSSPTGIIICAVAAGVLGALISFPFLDLRTSVIVTAVTAVVLGLAFWLFARWLGRHSTVVRGKTLARHLAEGSRACRLLHDYAAWEYAEERARISERHTRKQKEANEHYLPLFDAQRKQYDAEMVRIETEYAAQVDRIGRQRAAETLRRGGGVRIPSREDGAPARRRTRRPRRNRTPRRWPPRHRPATRPGRRWPRSGWRRPGKSPTPFAALRNGGRRTSSRRGTGCDWPIAFRPECVAASSRSIWRHCPTESPPIHGSRRPRILRARFRRSFPSPTAARCCFAPATRAAAPRCRRSRR